MTVIYFNLKGNLKTSFALADIEIVIHAWLCTVVLGWISGFYIYLIAIPMFIFLTPWPPVNKILVSAASGTICLIMIYYSQITGPLITLEPVFINIFISVNIVFIFTAISYFAYYYRASVIKVEANLELEHRRTNEALIERDKILTQLNEELAEAATYVTNILPQPINEERLKTDWRFIPSTSLGGDAFGYHWIDEDHFAIYLIDVSGHGVGAALLSVSVMNVLRSQSLPNTDFKDPEQVLTALNFAFPGEENNDMFFTIWYGVYKQSARDLIYASGGHPPALLIDNTPKGNFQAKRLRTPNSVIGGMSEGTYQKEVCQVSEQNKLYIFSDGVYEVEKTDGSMWRFQEFADFMNSVKTDGQSILDRLYDHAKNLSNLENFEDDFTIVEIAFG